QLLSEGYLEAFRGSGTFVCAQLPDELLHTDPIRATPAVERPSVVLSSYGKRLAETPFDLQTEPTQPISFRYGRPALKDFPLALWRKLLSRHCRNFEGLDYATDFLGVSALRQAIAQYVSRARAVRCDPDQIIITNGTQQALDLVMRLLMEPGMEMAIEDPGYLSARRIFLSHGVKLLPIPVDAAGLQVDKLANCGSAVSLVYVTPSHQFPTGATLSLPRRLELLAWAQQNQALILEDDYDSEYRYGDRPIPALQGLSQIDCVIYIGTFSKVLFPALRIGYLILPPHLVRLFAQAKWLSDRQLPVLEQLVLADFIREGHLERHIRKMRSIYDLNRRTLVQALKEQFGEQVEILGEEAGIHVMVRLKTHLSDATVIKRAASVGVGLMSAQAQYLDAFYRSEFIFGYG
ncbi:MAG TPA: PLP-dependent aminotransferase family protein, partial [Allocoleopsis sp.]